jgi:hypothetical protein
MPSSFPTPSQTPPPIPTGGMFPSRGTWALLLGALVAVARGCLPNGASNSGVTQVCLGVGSLGMSITNWFWLGGRNILMDLWFAPVILADLTSSVFVNIISSTTPIIHIPIKKATILAIDLTSTLTSCAGQVDMGVPGDVKPDMVGRDGHLPPGLSAHGRPLQPPHLLQQ